MSVFPTVGHFASWAGACPGHHESPGRERSGRTRPGPALLTSQLTECARAAVRTKGTYLAELLRLEWLAAVRPIEAVHTIRSRLQEILDRLTRIGDQRGLARAHHAACLMRWDEGRMASAWEHSRLAAEHARAAGDRGLRTRMLALSVSVLCTGPLDARAIARELDAMEREQPGLYLRAFIELGRSGVALLDGLFDDARQLIENALEITRALGMRYHEGGFLMFVGFIELAAGDYAAAHAGFLRADAIQTETGDRSFRAFTQAMLAHIAALAGDRARAQAGIEFAERLAGPDESLVNARTRAIRARFALADGDAAAAERWARSAVHNTCLTDNVEEQANAKLELARILATLGRSAEARVEAQAGLDLYRAKGSRPGEAEAQALLDELVAGA